MANEVGDASQESATPAKKKLTSSHFELIAMVAVAVLAVVVRIDIFILSTICAVVLFVYLYTEAFLGLMVAYTLGGRKELPDFKPPFLPTARKVLVYTFFWFLLWHSPVLQTAAMLIIITVVYTYVYAHTVKPPQKA